MAAQIKTNIAPTTVTLRKRKRAQISYKDDDFQETQDHEVVDEDGIYGSRKKPTKRLKRSKTAAESVKAKSKKNEKPFLFLSLPPEIRDYIYELALTDPDGISLASKIKAYRRIVVRGPIWDQDHGCWWSIHDSGRRRQRHDRQQDAQAAHVHNPLSPAMLATCKQIHSEAVGYLYQQPIVLQDTYTLHNFLAGIGSYCPRLTDLTITGWGDGIGIHKAMNHCAFTLLSFCTNLTTLHFDYSIGHVRRPKNLARQFCRDGHGFFEAFGRVNGRKDAGVDVLKLNECNYDRNQYYSLKNRGLVLPEKDEFKAQFQAALRELLSR